MHSTKTGILALLKRNGGSTVDELASTLGLASMTVRQHLTALERDALVRAEEVRRQTGRPHFLYRLTDDGHRRVAEGYDRLVALLVEEAGRLDSGPAHSEVERRIALFRNAATTLAGRHRAHVLGLEAGDQAERVASVLRSFGGFPEWREHPRGFELRDFSCVMRAHVEFEGPCPWHETFLSAVIGAPVEVAPPPEESCAVCCRYIVAIRELEPVSNRGS